MFVLVGRSICRSVGRSVILSLKGGRFNSHAPIRALYYKCESDLRIEHIFQTQLFLSPLDATPPPLQKQNKKRLGLGSDRKGTAWSTENRKQTLLNLPDRKILCVLSVEQRTL